MDETTAKAWGHVALYQALLDLGDVAEFLHANDFDVALRRLEEARVRIRRVANHLSGRIPVS